MGLFTESSIEDLYNSAVRAFPLTTKRQHAVDPVIVEELRWTPYLGVKTLFVRGAVRNESRHYNTLFLFKNMRYDENGVTITASDGRNYTFAKIPFGTQDVLVRCDCPDFKWRFNYYNHLDSSLYGNKRGKYEGQGGPPANPLKLPGMCKHLMKTASALRDAGLFTG